MLRIAGAGQASVRSEEEDGQLALAPSPQLSPAFPQTSELSPEPEPDTGSVSVLVTCSSYSQSYGGYLKIYICVQYRNIVALFSDNDVC